MRTPIRRAVAWIVELSIQSLLGAYILYLVFGSNGKAIGALQNFEENLFYVVFFVISSGYFATTAWFAIVKPRENVLRQFWVNVLLFCAHAGLFLVLSIAPVGNTFGVLALGVGAVAFATVIGSTIRAWGSNVRDAERQPSAP